MAEGSKPTVTIDADAIEGADANGDGHVSKEEMEMHLEFKRKALEDAEFEAMMSGIAPETKKEDKKVDSAPVVGDANAKNKKKNAL